MNTGQVIRILYIAGAIPPAYQLSQVLSSSLYEVDIVSGAQDGVAGVLNHACDLILVDQNLPDITGIDLVDLLKKQYRVDIPVILLIAGADEKLVDPALESGVDDFVVVDVDATFIKLMPLTIKKVMTQYRISKEYSADRIEHQALEQELANRIEQFDALYKIEASLTRTLEITSVYETAVSSALRFSNADYAYIAIAEQDSLRIVYFIGDPELEIEEYTVIPEDSISWRVFRNQESELIKDVRLDPNFAVSWSKTLSQMTFPLTSSGREIGILGLETSKEGAFTEDVFAFVSLIARRIASAVDNSQLFARVQDQLYKLERLHDDMVHRTMHDPLTGLPNRVLFQKRLAETIQTASIKQEKVGLLYVDLDGFKRINDTAGHDVGDRILAVVSKRLKQCVRSVDTIARMGGDEFAIILPGIVSSSEAYTVAKRILERIHEPMMTDGTEHYLSASIGVSSFPENAQTADALLRKADAALYSSKIGGKNNINLYDTNNDRTIIEAFIIGNLLHGAFSNDELEVHYQPQVQLATKTVIGAEALLRWKSPVKGNVPPGKFLPAAREVGLLIPITNYVFQEVCKQQDTWWRAGHHLLLSVNVAIPQFEQDNFVDLILETAGQFSFPFSSIQLEFTEQLMMKNMSEATAKIDRLREAGFKVALDDFGTGYSSLSYLQRLPIDTLKIDRSLVMDMIGDGVTANKSLAIIGVIQLLASKLNYQLVAEGIETEHQFQHLHELEVDVGQGFLFSPALRADLFEIWLAEYSEE